MKFTVVWSRAAEDELTEIWLSMEDRSGITEASREIDQRWKEILRMKASRGSIDGESSYCRRSVSRMKSFLKTGWFACCTFCDLEIATTLDVDRCQGRMQ
ncbi:MAG: hypothetical protein IH991_14610 [Planctomycetes bacterium]|nr:hypothetical protein [Planctomycetota bacterium]